MNSNTPEEKQALADLGFTKEELESDPIPTVTEEGRAGAETLVTVANQIIEGLIGDTRSVADRSKPDYLYHKAKQPDKTIETEFEMKRRNKIEKSMKQRTAEDGLILEHLDADRNLITGLIRKHIPAGALQDWALKKAARILAPFQAAKPVEAILYTIADNLMYDEAKKEMVIAPKRKPLDFSKKPVRYEYDPNTKLGMAALRYFHTLNDDFKKIIIDRAKKNNEYRKDFLERVIPYEKAKTYLALFGRTKLNGVGEKTIEGRSRIAYSMIKNLEGKIDQTDYNNLMADFEQINNLGNEQIGRQAGNINRIIADLVGNPNASASSLTDRIELLNSNQGIYGYVHHHMSIDPKNKAGKAFNALGKLGHPWLETVPGFNKARSGYDGTKSLLIADIARSTKGITAEAANRWMADAEDQRGIPVDLIKDPDKDLPAGYEKHQIVIANFGRYRGKQIYVL